MECGPPQLQTGWDLLSLSLSLRLKKKGEKKTKHWQHCKSQQGTDVILVSQELHQMCFCGVSTLMCDLPWLGLIQQQHCKDYVTHDCKNQRLVSHLCLLAHVHRKTGRREPELIRWQMSSGREGWGVEGWIGKLKRQVASNYANSQVCMIFKAVKKNLNICSVTHFWLSSLVGWCSHSIWLQFFYYNNFKKKQKKLRLSRHWIVLWLNGIPCVFIKYMQLIALFFYNRRTNI